MDNLVLNQSPHDNKFFSVLTVDSARSLFGGVVSSESGGVVGRVGLEDDEEMVGRGEDVSRQLGAAVRADHRRLVVRAVVDRHRVVARRLRQRLFQLEALETQQDVLPTTIHRPTSTDISDGF